MKIALFGGTGSAGGCVLRTALGSSHVSEVRAVTRRAIGADSPRLRETLHHDYLNLDALADVLTGVDACFYCLGKSVRQTSGEAEYRRITYDFAIAAAAALRVHSRAGVFHFISGAGAALNSPFMWARVKAETERELVAQFNAVCYRPAHIDGMPSASEPPLYKVLRPVARVVFRPFQNLYITGDDIGRAMLAAAQAGMRNRILTNAEIRALAREYARKSTERRASHHGRAGLS